MHAGASYRMHLRPEGRKSMRSTPAARVATLLLLSLTAATAQTATSRIVTAAKTFLSTLDQKQRQRVLFAFDDDTQRARWSNLPTSLVPRAGLSLKEMNPAQRSAAMALVASALSPRGFEKVQQIMEGDEVNQDQRRKQPDVRQRSLLHLHPRNAFRKGSLDAPVRRAPSGAEYHHRRRAWHSHSHPDRRPARSLHCSTGKPCAPSARRATRRSRC